MHEYLELILIIFSVASALLIIAYLFNKFPKLGKILKKVIKHEDTITYLITNILGDRLNERDKKKFKKGLVKAIEIIKSYSETQDLTPDAIETIIRASLIGVSVEVDDELIGIAVRIIDQIEEGIKEGNDSDE